MVYGNLLQLLARQNDGATEEKSGPEQLVDLLKDPFEGTLAVASVYSAAAISLTVTGAIAIAFSFLRPYHQVIYAPKSKHADEKHAPPALGKAPWSWLIVVWKTTEDQLVEQIGMDATIFLRFLRMIRNLFLVLTVVGVAIVVPVNLSNYNSNADTKGQKNAWLMRITPLGVWGGATWSQVALAWSFDIIIMGFLWWNYRKVLQLRRRYFESTEYQQSLHSRTLMMFDIPKQGCSDEGIARIIDEVVPNSSFARTAIARNVKDLPDLIKEHDKAVRKLEKVLAKYLKNPQQLPPARPTCKPSKKDRSYGTYAKGQKLDAIEYYTQRIRDLEVEIKEVRASVDKRSTLPYGFASYSDIAEAHSIAYALRKKKPHGATVTLAPRPSDIIWDNMPLSSGARSRKRWFNNFWIAVLTIFWIVPNAFIAVFLVNLNNLGKLWPAFQTELFANPSTWGAVQGIAAPALTSLVYLLLPIMFRRMSMRSGDKTKTGRERHVLAKLYSFFIFNNLIIFNVFSSVWALIAKIVEDADNGHDVWKGILRGNFAGAVFTALCNNSVFWVTYLLQRQLGAAVDLAQLWPLITAFWIKTFSSPTPRELIEATAPPPFDYAPYYNYFLFYASVTFCLAGIQPLVLPATALYFIIDAWLKKYLLLYRFVTKTESGGVFWRVVFNRMIFATVLGNLVVLLTTWVRGDGLVQFYAVCPLPIIMIAFKFYCRRVYDDKIRYYSTRLVGRNPENGLNNKEDRQRSERLASRFGHPALYKRLITPMVHQKAQNVLPSIYKGRLTGGREEEPDDTMTVSGYSDMYALSAMQGGKPGKSANAVPGFEIVSENKMDFQYFKNRAEFTEEHGGAEMYGITRPGTPGSFGDGRSDFYTASRPGSPSSGRSTPFRAGHMQQGPAEQVDTSYTAYRPPVAGFAQQTSGMERGRSPLYAQDNSSATGLVRGAVPMASVPGSRDQSLDGRMTPPAGFRSPPVQTPAGMTIGALGGGPQGYSGLAQGEDDNDGGDPTQYDYFRGARSNRRNPGEGW